MSKGDGSDGEPPQAVTEDASAEAPSTNRLIADVLVDGVGKLARQVLQQRSAIAPYNPDAPRDYSDGRAALSAIAVYGASKLAARGSAGLALVAGGLILKTLYERGKAKELAELDDEMLGEKQLEA